MTAEERAAMRERVRELRTAKGTDGEQEVLAKISEMPKEDRLLAERFHALVKKVAPELAPRTWYGMPAYAKNGSIVCFFQPASKFKARYATVGFSDKAALDDGALWPTSYALTALGPGEEKRLGELIQRAVS
ncbi:MAG: hypothetical protein K6T28_02925 [Acidothermus sp.]|nr:hypothetical protein [Acidothermus sp.]